MHGLLSCGGSEAVSMPKAIIVHDPVVNGSLEYMARENRNVSVEEKFLFRQLPDVSLFSEQYVKFVEAVKRVINDIYYLHEIVGKTSVFESAKYNPNQVYTRDGLITLPWIADSYIQCRMAKPIRKSEPIILEAAARYFGLNSIVDLPEGLILEGGDVIPWMRHEKRSLLMGYGQRTTIEAIEYLSTKLIPKYIDEIIGIRLAPWRINLDGGLVPIADNVVIAQPESLLDAFMINERGKVGIDIFKLFKDFEVDVVSVSIEESIYQQACNCLCLGNRRIICYDMCDRIMPILEKLQIDAISISGSELVCGTGGPRCMTRPIY